MREKRKKLLDFIGRLSLGKERVDHPPRLPPHKGIDHMFGIGFVASALRNIIYLQTRHVGKAPSLHQTAICLYFKSSAITTNKVKQFLKITL